MRQLDLGNGLFWKFKVERLCKEFYSSKSEEISETIKVMLAAGSKKMKQVTIEPLS